MFSLPLEIPGKTSLDTWKLCKTVYTGNSKVKLNKYQDLWKFHNFFLNTHVNSIFLLQPWNLHMFSPGTFMSSTPPVFFFSGITPSSGVAFGTLDSSATWGCLAGAGEKNTWLAKFQNYPYTINLPGLVLLLFLLNVLLSSILGFPILHSE